MEKRHSCPCDLGSLCLACCGYFLTACFFRLSAPCGAAGGGWDKVEVQLSQTGQTHRRGCAPPAGQNIGAAPWGGRAAGTTKRDKRFLTTVSFEIKLTIPSII